jgi:hypothetical protein
MSAPKTAILTRGRSPNTILVLQTSDANLRSEVLGIATYPAPLRYCVVVLLGFCNYSDGRCVVDCHFKNDDVWAL